MSATSVRSELQHVKAQFEEASRRWPVVESLLVTWNARKKAPTLPEDLDTQYAPGGRTATGHSFIAILLGGGSGDTPAGRFRAGRAGMHILRWNATPLFGDRREIPDPNEAHAAGERLALLIVRGIPYLDAARLSPDARAWCGPGRKLGWMLAVHELVEPDDRPEIDGGQVERFRDFFHASAKACDVLGDATAVDPLLEARRRFCFEEALSRAPWQTIGLRVNQLADERGWYKYSADPSQLASNAIRDARAYAKAHRLSIPPRKRGRPSL